MGVSYNPRIVTDGLVLCLDAGNTKSYPGTGTAWNDLSGKGNHASLINGPNFNNDNNGTISFDGVNDYTETTTLKPSGPRTYFIWIKYNTINSLPGGFSLSGTQDANSYNYVGIQNGGVFYYYAGLNGGSISSCVLSANTWYQQGFSLFSDGSRKVYSNGIEIASSAGSLGTTAVTNFFLGRVSAGHYVNGFISNVTYYNRALSAAEIQQNFNATRGRYGI